MPRLLPAVTQLSSVQVDGRALLVQKAILQSQVDQLASAGESLTVDQVKLCCPVGRAQLVLCHLDFGSSPHDPVPQLQGAGAGYLQPYRGRMFECSSAWG